MLSTASRSSGKHTFAVGVLVVSTVALFAVLVQFAISLASAPPPQLVSGSFGSSYSADYGTSQSRAIAPQRPG
jgi:hypothetical protein